MQSIKQIAWHEAGHVLMHLHENVEFLFVTLIPEIGSAGHVQRGEQGLMDLDRSRSELQIGLAGHFAEELFRGKDLSLENSRGATVDKIVIDNILKCLSDETEAKLFYDWVYYRARKIIQDNKPAIEAIANALLASKNYTLTYQDICAMSAFI